MTDSTPLKAFLELAEADASPDDFLEAMLDIETVGIIFFDPRGDLVFANDAFLRMSGYTRQDLDARRLRWDAMTPPEWMKASLRAIDQLRTRGSTEPYVKQYYRKGGGRFWGLFAAKGLSSRLGVEFVLDITERKRVEAEREQLLHESQEAREAAQAANRAKTDFLMAMSHDLRTPLNAIAGYVDLMELEIQGPITEAQREALERIRVNGRHLLTLISDVLTYATVDAGRLSLDIRSLRAEDLLRSLGPLVEPLADREGVGYVYEECDPALRLMGDEERVRQILLNLITNGIKFTQEGGCVWVGCEAQDAHVRIAVADNGPGIPEDLQEVIFQPFVQVDRRIDRPREGVGLGLAISCDLAHAMGGTLVVESTVGQGSRFELVLPAAVDEA